MNVSNFARKQPAAVRRAIKALPRNREIYDPAWPRLTTNFRQWAILTDGFRQTSGRELHPVSTGNRPCWPALCRRTVPDEAGHRYARPGALEHRRAGQGRASEARTANP